MQDGATSKQIFVGAWRAEQSVRPGGAADSTSRSQGRVVPLIVGVWLLGLMPASLADPPLAACAALTLAVWVVTLWRRPREDTWLTAVMTISSSGVIVLSSGGIGDPQTPLAAAWFDATAVAAGLGMASMRRAVAASASVAGVSLVAWFGIALTGPLDGGWRSAVAWPTATLGLGLATAMAMGVIRAGALRLDEVTAAAESAATPADVDTVARNTFQRYARLLHDTAINTLGAVGQGIPAASRDLVPVRARHDLGLLAGADPDAPDDPIEMLRARAAALSFPLQVHGSSDGLREVPAPAISAAFAALGEALLNASKHSHARQARLSVVEDGDTTVMTLADDGTGWDGSYRSDGGIAQSILARCAEADVDVRIDTRPGGGAAVTLTLHRPPSRPERLGRLVPAEIQAIAAVGCGAIVVEVGVRSVLGIGLFPGLGSLVAFAVLLAALSLAWYARLPGRNPARYTAWAVLTVSLVPIVFLLPLEANGSLAWGWWATIACLPVFGALILLDAPAVVVLAAYCAQAGARLLLSDYPGDIVFPDLLSIGLGVLAMWLVRNRVYRMVVRSRAMTVDLIQRREETLRSLASHRAGARQLQQITGPARGLLEGLADGSVDPDDPLARQRCTEESRYLRSVSRLGPHLADSDLGLLPLVAGAHHRHIPLTVTVDPQVKMPTGDRRLALGRAITGLLPHCSPDGSCSLSLLHTDGMNTLLVVTGPDGSALPGEIVASLRATGFAVDEVADATSSYVEITWSDSDSDSDERWP